MPPAKDHGAQHSYRRSFSNNGMTMSARVYHPATNLMPPTPPQSPTGVSPPFGDRSNTHYSKQNSQSGNGKHS